MNLYQPHLMRIDEITDETPDTRSFRLSFQEPALREAFQFSAGQFGEYSVFGEGESTFCIASPARPQPARTRSSPRRGSRRRPSM